MEQLASRYTDGTEQEGPVTKREMKALLAPHSSQLHIYAMGLLIMRLRQKLGPIFLHDSFKRGQSDGRGVST